MKLAVMQPYFFPYIGYFQCISAVDKYIVYDKLNYIYQGWVDRNRLVDKSGKIFYIRPQLKDASTSRLISEIQLQPKQFWREKLLKTLKFSYAGAVYFEEALVPITQALAYETEFLSDFNFHSIKCICRFLDIDTELTNMTQGYEMLELELKDTANQRSLETISDLEIKVIRALRICETEKADVFINAIGGKELYDKSIFKKHNIELKFIRANEITYSQFAPNFFSGLSIIDVLMHNGKEGTKKLLTEYELI
jgi:hypothetical protein